MEKRNISADIFMNNSSESNVVVDNHAENIQVDASNYETVNTQEGLVDIINFKNLTQIFNKGEKKEYKLFENFNLNIPDIPNVGQLVSIMDGSGCGKSRLVRVLCGLDSVQSGSVDVYGKPVSEFNNIPMVFQTYSNYEWMTVLENVMLPMTLKGVNKEDAKKQALELLKIVGLEDKADNYPARLSGGQQQRISIARCLACNSQIIVFDEATGALDIKMKREVQNIILKIFYESKLDPTILNITHSIEEACYISNKIVILKPNPCTVYKEIDIHYTGEENRPRGEWIFDTPEYAAYVKEVTRAMDEACK